MYYARVMFDTIPGNFLNDNNETEGIEVFSKKESVEYLKRIQKVDSGLKSYYNIAFFVGPFEDLDMCISHGKKLFYAVLRYYYWIGCPFIVEPMVTECMIANPEMSHFITTSKNKCDINSLQIIQVEKNLDEYYLSDDCIEYVMELHQKFPMEDFDTNELEYNEMCASVFELVNSSQRVNDYNFSIQLLCTAIEYMANIKIEEKLKSKEELQIFDKLIQVIEETNEFDKQAKENVKSYLSNGINIGSRKKCSLLIGKYAKREYSVIGKESKYKPMQIFKYCYGYRSSSAHGGFRDDVNYTYLQLMRYVVLDVLENILREENPEIDTFFEPKLFQIGMSIR